MNKRQKILAQNSLNSEETVLKRLEYIYDKSRTDINAKIRNLQFRIDELTEEYDWAEDAEKDKIKSKIQSKIYQKQYQEQLQKQVDGILNQMQTQQYVTIADYLNECYSDGFVGTIFDMHGQGVPLMMPINQESMVKAIQLDSKISKGLYTKLGVDVATLKKRIAAQVTRGIANGSSFREVAEQLNRESKIGRYKAMRIARTEGHRIQNTAIMDASYDARDRGADLVKQWDATLDGKTRDSHVAVDMEIRELDEAFSNGLQYPSDPAGSAAEVINCRCRLNQRARWALGGSFTKFNNFTKQIEEFESPEAYEDFKKGFFSTENKEYMNYVQQMEKKYGKNFEQMLGKMSDREYNRYSKLLKVNPVYNKNAAPVLDPVKADMFPDMFRKTGVGKKATQVMADALNGVVSLNPSIHKLYTNLDKLPSLPTNGKISYTMDGHELGRWENSAGQVTRYELKIPKMEGADLMGQRCTTFHEIGHYIDMGTGTGNGKYMKSHSYKDLTDAIDVSKATMSTDVKKLFDDFAQQYKKMSSDTRAKYGALRQQLNDDYHAKKLTYKEYNKRWDASVRDQNRERDYLGRNLCGGGVDMLSDIYDALSNGTYQDNKTLLYGHGGAYYANRDKRNSEILANYMSLNVNRPDLVGVLRKDKPKVCEALDKLIDEMAGDVK